jgi:ABC-2 type transport system permease protein
LIGYISLSYHFSAFYIGIIDTQALVYYLSVTVLFLYLAIRSLDSSRWS